MSNQQQKKKKWGKRRDVAVGDIVRIRGNVARWCGSIGIVTVAIDRNRIVWKPMAPEDEDYGLAELLAYTRTPKGQTKGGANRVDIIPHVAQVVVAVADRPAKPVKTKVAVEIHDEAVLLEHLAGERELAKHEFPVIHVDAAANG